MIKNFPLLTLFQPKRTPQVIRVCSLDPSSNESRGLPAPLSQALQLSRMDRLFIDELIRTVLLWYQAKAHLVESSILPGDVDISELLSQDEKASLAEQYLSGLTPSQRTVLMRFPSKKFHDVLAPSAPFAKEWFDMFSKIV